MAVTLLALAVLALVMTAGWLFQRRAGNGGWTDVFWTFGTGGACIGAALLPAGPLTTRQMVVAALAAVWSLRLGTYILRRVSGSGEDSRYAELREEWGPSFQRRMFGFLLAQAPAGAILAGAAHVAAHNPEPFGRVQDYAAVLLFLLAVCGETLADAQLQRFKADPSNRGRVADVGLWAWSRHPNYFFEWLLWLAFPLLAIAPGYAPGWWALAAPALMFVLLNYVTGVPPVERSMRRTRGAAFDAYAARTSRFFPLPPGNAMSRLKPLALRVAERAPLPDSLTRAGVDVLVGAARRRLARATSDAEALFVEDMARRPIAESPDAANRQHYEVPAAFFEKVLGPHMKYSCCLFADGVRTLGEAEEAALLETAVHAGLRDGQDILELGCGWGSLTLWMAEALPRARITAVSNSASQRAHIERKAAERGLANVRVVTADATGFEPAGRFDRIVSVEMFEHMSNWRALLTRARGWLKPEGRVFLHVFSHQGAPYRFDAEDPDDWIGQHFFTGGIMPSHGLIRRFDDLFEVEAEWRWSGAHYRRTADQWLKNFDANREAIAEVLARTYGADAQLWSRRWRLFFLATAGLFGHADGEPWGVSHYRLKPSEA